MSLVFVTRLFFFFGGGGGGGGVLCHSAVQTDFEFEISGSLIKGVMRKPVFGVSKQVRHKLGCMATEVG